MRYEKQTHIDENLEDLQLYIPLNTIDVMRKCQQFDI